MIAQVYPISRMPRKVHVFDYEIPEELLLLKRGDVVSIPFRNSVILGIIADIKDKPFRGITLKAILKQDPRASFSEKELVFYETLATELAQSVASVLFSCLPTFPKRMALKESRANIAPQSLTIPQSESEELMRIGTELGKRHHAFARINDIRRMTAVITRYLREKPEQKCVILAPTVLDAKRMFAHLQEFSPHLLTGEENQSQQFFAWKTFRESIVGMLIGTKNALFSVDPNTTTLFVVRSGHRSHGHHEQNPRFDARAVAELFLQQYQTNVFYLDVMPSVDNQHQFTETNRIIPHTIENAMLINMEEEQFHKPIHSAVSESVLEKIGTSLQNKKRVLCVLNKKFRAKRLRCQTCKNDVLCPTCQNSLILDGATLRCVRCRYTGVLENTCQTCQTKTLVESGFGNQKTVELLQEEFPDSVCCVIDKEHPELNAKASIFLVTSYYLEQLFDPFHPEGFDIVVLLDADAPLYRSSYRAVEEALYEFEQWNAVAFANRASYLVQTRSIPLFQEYVKDPKTFLDLELAARISYEQPPFIHLASLQFTESDPRKADLQISTYVKQIRAHFPEIRLQKISSATSNEYALEIRFKDAEKAALLAFLRTFPDDTIIDTQADLR